MKTINKILVAVDFSDHSLAAIKYAASLARDVEADLLLVNVINQRDVNMMEKIAARYADFSLENSLKETLEEREKSFEEYIAASDCNHTKVKTLIRIGIPHKALLKEIREQKADLLVMAAKGRSNLMDTVIGSCAQKMFRKSPIPVLSIRGQKV